MPEMLCISNRKDLILLWPWPCLDGIQNLISSSPAYDDHFMEILQPFLQTQGHITLRRIAKWWTSQKIIRNNNAIKLVLLHLTWLWEDKLHLLMWIWLNTCMSNGSVKIHKTFLKIKYSCEKVKRHTFSEQVVLIATFPCSWDSTLVYPSVPLTSIFHLET